MGTFPRVNYNTRNVVLMLCKRAFIIKAGRNNSVINYGKAKERI